MQTLSVILLALALAITAGVLFAGLIVMARGGETSRKYSNKLMRWRVIAQGVALIIFAIAIALKDG